MAKYDVRFSCGHTETVQLYGKDADRRKKIWYYENHGICKECYRKQQEEMADENLAGIEFTGTEKQIAYVKKLLRNATPEKVEQVKKAIAATTDEEVAIMVEKYGKPIDFIYRCFMNGRGMLDAYLAATTTDAGDIIDAMTNTTRYYM